MKNEIYFTVPLSVGLGCVCVSLGHLWALCFHVTIVFLIGVVILYFSWSE